MSTKWILVILAFLMTFGVGCSTTLSAGQVRGGFSIGMDTQVPTAPGAEIEAVAAADAPIFFYEASMPAVAFRSAFNVKPLGKAAEDVFNWAKDAIGGLLTPVP